MDEAGIEALLATVTPERVRALSAQIEARQPEVNRGTAPLWEILEELMHDVPLMDAAARYQLELRLRKAVKVAVSMVAGMSLVEGDS